MPAETRYFGYSMAFSSDAVYLAVSEKPRSETEVR
jgi:hypothetical protein